MTPAMLIRVAQVLLLVASAVHLAVVPTAAQGPPTLSSGDEVRLTVTSRSHDQLVGTLAGLDGRNMTLIDQRGNELHVPIDSVSALAKLIGEERNTKRGVVVGLALGGVVGALLGRAADPHSDCGGQAGLGECPIWLISAGLFGTVGAVVGGLVGRTTRREVWEDVPLTILQSPGGGATLSIGWRLPVGFPVELRHR